MAMNKKEQAAFTAMQQELTEARAMRLSGYTMPIPISYDEIKAYMADYKTNVCPGWFVWTYNGQYRVTHGCSSAVYHSNNDTKDTNTQGMGTMYLTKRDALIVARLKLEKEMSKVLAKLDAELAERPA